MDSCRGGVRVVVRDEEGNVRAAFARPIQVAGSVLHMEAEAIRAGLLIAIHNGWRDVIIESDCSALVSTLNSSNAPAEEVSNVILDCRHYMRDFDVLQVRHVYREANGVTHKLAHLANISDLDAYWIEECPIIIRDVLYEDECIILRGSGTMSPSLYSSSLSINNNPRHGDKILQLGLGYFVRKLPYLPIVAINPRKIFKTTEEIVMNLSSVLKILPLKTYRYYTSATSLHHLQPPNLHHLLQLCITHRSAPLAQQVHARVLTHGLHQNPFLATKLISAYALFLNPAKSKLVFDSIELKNVYLWNSMINGYVRNCDYSKAMALFVEMLCYSDDVSPDDYTLATMAKVSGEVGDLVVGKWVQGKSIRIGFGLDIVVGNSLMSMYVKCGEFGECRKVFDEMPERNVGSWNVLISGHANCSEVGFDGEVLEVAKCMMESGMKPDGFTVSSLLPLCGSNYGKELHCFIVKYGLDLDFGSDVHLGCCLVDMYCRSGRADLGRRVFDRMKCRNVYAWTAMVNGYVQNGASDEALSFFRMMQVEGGIQPNRVSLVSVLPACTSRAGLMGGKQVHAFAIRNEMTHDVSLSNALIDMYCKYGSLDFARQVFEGDSFCKDTISWSAMISGYGLHGRGEEAIVLYNEMLRLGIKPDMITIVGVLSACGKSGLVNEGLSVYSSATTDFGIKPTVEMCSCVVDLLGRSGELDRSYNFIKTMPVEPGPSVWGALVTASVLHGNRDMQDLAYKFLIQLEPENPSNYISTSNFYATSRRWDFVAETRTMMKDKGLRKTPGCSWINITGQTHSFYVADKVHPCCELIYEMLDYLTLVMKVPCGSHDFCRIFN